jgi:methionyl-tRNA synthetase
MPYKSDAQRRKFHAMEDSGEIDSKTVEEYDKASKGMNLPERVGERKKTTQEKYDDERDRCKKCGRKLDDDGDCPKCDE